MTSSYFLFLSFLISVLHLQASGEIINLDNVLNGPGNVVVKGVGNNVVGINNTIEGDFNEVKGDDNVVKGNKSIVEGNKNSLKSSNS